MFETTRQYPDRPEIIISSYLAECYQPNGDRAEPFLSEKQIKFWDSMNQKNNGKLFGSGQKLVLPETAPPGFCLNFGKDPQQCDFKIDLEFYDNLELIFGGTSVSDVHFSLQLNSEGGWEAINKSPGKVFCCRSVATDINDPKKLKELSKPWKLEDGDALILPRIDPSLNSQEIIFIFRIQADGRPSLIKATANSVPELLECLGGYKDNQPKINVINPKRYDAEFRNEIEGIGQDLIQDLMSLREFKRVDKSNRAEYFNKVIEFEKKILDTLNQLSKNQCHDDLFWATKSMKVWAMSKSAEVSLSLAESTTKNPDALEDISLYDTLANSLNELQRKFS